ncbi:MAG: hypothetical protein FD130_2477 [Halothiobacillaceae bacterium]|nr:MAG: hypothetical protein FD130_2477 [Halothiobacillaceae bacterium]
MVALPAGQLPATGTRSDYLTATVALEETGHFAAAKLSYKAMAERWPEEPLLLMGLGNTAYAVADYEGAQSAFSKALALDPHQAAAWNNLGYALAQRGCQPAALSAVRCAVALEPGEHYQESLQEIGQMTAKNGLLCATPRCPIDIHSTLHSK